MSATVIAAMATAALLAIPAVAGAPAEPSGTANGTTSYARAETVSSRGDVGSYVDSREDARVLKVDLGSRYRYLVHSGVSGPGDTITISYQQAESGREVHAARSALTPSASPHSIPSTAARAACQLGQLLVRDAQQHGTGVQHPGRVQRAQQRQEVPGRVGETRDVPGRVSGRRRVHREHRPAGADRDHHITGLEAERERGGHVVPGADADQGTAGGPARRLGRA